MRKLPHGTQISLCNACGLVFKSVYAFDKHRTGRWPERTCRSLEDLLADGWAVNSQGRVTTGAFTFRKTEGGQ